MSQVLYRKYRPQNFNDVVGQDHIKTTIQNEIASGKVAHAYLFSGPRAVGKTTTARLLAKAVNCLKRKDGESEPCNKCESCREITGGASLDVIEIDAASHTGVDNVRENIINNAKFTPAKSKYKIFIIDEAHMLSTSAFNALLKILEEPPTYVIFILATTELHKVPATIVSRCQKFDFKKISSDVLVKRLGEIAKAEDVKIDEDVLVSIAYHSEGCARDAETLLGQLFNLGEERISLSLASVVLPYSNFNRASELFENLLANDASAGIQLVNSLIEEGVDLRQFLSVFIEFSRKALLLKVSPRLENLTAGLGAELTEKILKLTAATDSLFILRILNVFLSKTQELKYAAIPQLPLEMAIIEICEGSNAVPDNQRVGISSINKTNLIRDILAKKSKAVDDSAPVKSVNEDKKEELIILSGKSDSLIFLAQIMQKWDEVLAEAAQRSTSLSYMLAVTKPMGMENNCLTLAFKFKLQKDKMDKSKGSLEDILEKIYGVKILVKTVLVPELEINVNRFQENSPRQESNIVDEGVRGLLEVFGGSLVE